MQAHLGIVTNDECSADPRDGWGILKFYGVP